MINGHVNTVYVLVWCSLTVRQILYTLGIGCHCYLERDALRYNTSYILVCPCSHVPTPLFYQELLRTLFFMIQNDCSMNANIRSQVNVYTGTENKKSAEVEHNRVTVV